MKWKFLIFLPFYSIIVSFTYFFYHERILNNISANPIVTISGKWKKGYCIYGNVLQRERNSKDVISLILHSSQDKVDHGIVEQVKLFRNDLFITNDSKKKVYNSELSSQGFEIKEFTHTQTPLLE